MNPQCSGPVEAAPEGGVVSEVGRTGEGREPNNDTTPTPQNSGRCGGRATPTGPTKDAENRKGGERTVVEAEVERLEREHAAVMATLCSCGHPYSVHNKERGDGGPPFCSYTLSRRCGCNGIDLPL